MRTRRTITHDRGQLAKVAVLHEFRCTSTSVIAIRADPSPHGSHQHSLAIGMMNAVRIAAGEGMKPTTILKQVQKMHFLGSEYMVHLTAQLFLFILYFVFSESRHPINYRISTAQTAVWA
jgi:hypothetical protein